MSKRTGVSLGAGLVLAVAALSACAGGGEAAGAQEQPTQTEPVLLTGNQTCSDAAPGTFELKVEPVADGTYTDGTLSVTIDVDGAYFDWESNLGVDAVVVKGGPNANLYLYDPEADSDTGLHAPINASTGHPYGLSHISFCYDIELEVEKTADTSVEVTYGWTVEKTADPTVLALTSSAPGNVGTVDYTVVYDRDGGDASAWFVEGEITIHNPAPVAATITSITDTIGALAVDVECETAGGVPITTFPYALAAGAHITCTYAAELSGGAAGTNTVVVETSGAVGGDTASAPFDFTGATVVDTIDECVVVDDTWFGTGAPNGEEICEDRTFTYSRTFLWSDPAICPAGATVENTASFVTTDTETPGEDSASVTITCGPPPPPPPPECPPPPPPPCGWCPCPPPPPPPPECPPPPPPPPGEGCTLTQGYWKTHAPGGPPPYDTTWAEIPEGATEAYEDAEFFQSGHTAVEILWMPPKKGNAYLILAHQYIAATLNMATGASVPAAVQAAYDDATALFEASSGTTLSAGVRAEAIWLAGILADYNEGDLGPGHCE